MRLLFFQIAPEISSNVVTGCAGSIINGAMDTQTVQTEVTKSQAVIGVRALFSAIYDDPGVTK